MPPLLHVATTAQLLPGLHHVENEDGGERIGVSAVYLASQWLTPMGWVPSVALMGHWAGSPSAHMATPGARGTHGDKQSILRRVVELWGVP